MNGYNGLITKLVPMIPEVKGSLSSTQQDKEGSRNLHGTRVTSGENYMKRAF